MCGVAPGASYNEYLPGCQRAIIFANGGTALWDSFVDDIQKNPAHLYEHLHPFDDFVHRMIQHADPSPPKTRRWIRCADNEEIFLDVRPIAQQAGLGAHSHMGMLIDETYGLWVGVRAVLLTTESLPLSSRVASSPCASCIKKPCISTCPGNAVRNTGWDVQRCAQFHMEQTDCQLQCSSRLSCPIGEEHRHSILQHQYHSNRSDGRTRLAKELGITDSRTGADLRWNDWI